MGLGREARAPQPRILCARQLTAKLGLERHHCRRDDHHRDCDLRYLRSRCKAGDCRALTLTVRSVRHWKGPRKWALSASSANGQVGSTTILTNRRALGQKWSHETVNRYLDSGRLICAGNGPLRVVCCSYDTDRRRRVAINYPSAWSPSPSSSSPGRRTTLPMCQ